jgi:two-component system sensor histidine kinase KdpD
VETPSERADRIDSEAQRHLQANFDLAKELGAEVVRLRGDDPVRTLLDFARTHRVGHLILGRSRESRLRALLGRSVLSRMIREAEDIDVHVASFTEEGASP